jgi:hypothetical protein
MEVKESKNKKRKSNNTGGLLSTNNNKSNQANNSQLNVTPIKLQKIITNNNVINASKIKEKKPMLTSPKNKNNQITLDEYQGISYKSSKITPVKTVDLYEDKQEIKKKSIEKDFRIKYKTEQCKFYQVNKECKFGDNVIYHLT